MRDTELYRHLLGLETPWTVANVELKVKEQRVDVWAEHGDTVWPCPECGKSFALYDHAPERSWRHLDSCQFMTYLHARIPRVECSEHGVHQVRVPWAEPKSRFTALFERLVIDVLKETDVTGATRILRITWDEAWHIMEQAVARGHGRKEKKSVRRIGIDEKSAAKGHRYLTIVSDLDHGTVEYIADERKRASLDEYFHQLTPEQKGAIEAVAMTCGTPSSARRWPTCRAPPRRSSSTSSTSSGTWSMLWTACAAGSTERTRPTEIRRSVGRSTSGSTVRRTCRRSIAIALRHCARRTSRRAVRGRSRRCCAASGATGPAAGRSASSTDGTAGRPTHASSR